MGSRLRKQSYWLLAAAVGIAIAAILFVTGRSPIRPAVQQFPATSSAASLRLSSVFEPTFAGAMVATRADLFVRAGVKVELRIGENTDDPISSVVRGGDSFGVTRADCFLRARAKGDPIVAFAAGFIESPALFLVLTSSGLRTPWDFVGRRIGRRAEDDFAIVYDALITKLGLQRSHIAEVPVGADLSPLLDEHVDVWPGHAGNEDYELDSKGVRYAVIAPMRYGVHLMGSVYFTSQRMIAERPQIVQRFLNGLIAGWNRVYQDYAASVPAIVSFDSERLRPDYVRYALERQREYVRPSESRYGEFNDVQWRSLQAVLLSQRRLERPVEIPDAVTYEFLREAYRKPLTYGQ